MKLNLLVSFFIFKSTIKRMLFAFVLIISFQSFAHGDLSARIAEKTAEISKTPNDSELYLERGFLFQQHLEYDKALKDYLKAKELGLHTKLLQYRISESLYLSEKFNSAYKEAIICLEFDEKDVKTKKLLAKISISLNEFDKALKAYDFVIKNTTDLRPEDIIEYAELILLSDPTNYNEAIKSLNFGLEKIGQDTFSLQLKKLEYFKEAEQIDNAINQYNYFILNNKRKEFWYFKKAQYLYANNKNNEALIAIKQSEMAIKQLDIRFQKMKSITNLLTKLETLENQLHNEN